MIIYEFEREGDVFVRYKWLPIGHYCHSEVSDVYTLELIISNLVDRINELGEEVVQLKNEAQGGR